jgi:hypothetical protein
MERLVIISNTQNEPPVKVREMFFQRRDNMSVTLEQKYEAAKAMLNIQVDVISEVLDHDDRAVTATAQHARVHLQRYIETRPDLAAAFTELGTELQDKAEADYEAALNAEKQGYPNVG